MPDVIKNSCPEMTIEDATPKHIEACAKMKESSGGASSAKSADTEAFARTYDIAGTDIKTDVSRSADPGGEQRRADASRSSADPGEKTSWETARNPQSSVRRTVSEQQSELARLAQRAVEINQLPTDPSPSPPATTSTPIKLPAKKMWIYQCKFAAATA